MTAPGPAPETAPGLRALRDFVTTHPRLFVLTGAGCSTASGIPDYRDRSGSWKRAAPMTLQTFMGTQAARARYWARSLIGWPRMAAVQPNAAHHALATLEQRGQIELLVTQNVDGLHRAAGSHAVLDLHGRLDQVRCTECGVIIDRDDWQQRMASANPEWLHLDASMAPDGDADLDGVDFSGFQVPSCPNCGGVIKPDVVFFGETVPPARVKQARDALDRADAVLIAGSSLMVFSGYRFALQAARSGKPMASINHGHNRAEALLDLKLDMDCGAALQALL